MATYDIGDVVRLVNVFRRGDTGAEVDPGAVTLTVKVPAGTSTTYTYPATITKDSTGHYHVDLAPDATGTYRYRWASTVSAVGAEEGWFQVRPRKVT